VRFRADADVREISDSDSSNAGRRLKPTLELVSLRKTESDVILIEDSSDEVRRRWMMRRSLCR